jgi:uncharacterized membrane protein YczE
MKRIFYTEIAYLLGIFGLALGTVFMVKADFGMSMVVAPAYLIYRKLSLSYSFITFGIAEYIMQALLLCLLILILRKFRIYYLFSFVTALYYGFLLDLCMGILKNFAVASLIGRVTCFVFGVSLCANGIAFIFRTYVAPEVYELFVKEVSKKMKISITKFKTGYDITSCLISILLSFLFFGFMKFVGVNIGTIICALTFGKLISIFGSILDKHLQFKDALPLRKYFE